VRVPLHGGKTLLERQRVHAGHCLPRGNRYGARVHPHVWLYHVEKAHSVSSVRVSGSC
jgi:hypothetical protein